MTVDQMRDQMHEVFAEIRQLRAFARFHGADYTGPTTELPARLGAFGRVIAPARTVKPSGPTITDLIEIRWDAIRWLQHEIREQLGVPHPASTH
ncbi:hypothetical protein [Nocardia sp. NPDC051833]|uniref:hypothetical protein n=1 Tax=Nocardia sp. NPDC051833 TaxID=3155674 RepID=UPI003418CB88